MNTEVLRIAFEKRVMRGHPDECWLWRGNIHRSGYGVIFNRKLRRTLRANCSVVDWTRVHALGLRKVNIHLTHELRTPLADVLDTTLTKKEAKK